jgi:hypothetical protein
VAGHGPGQEGSVIADPKFVDPENYDFRFASDEVIKQTGFQPFDYSQAGVYGDAAWIALAMACCQALPPRKMGRLGRREPHSSWVKQTLLTITRARHLGLLPRSRQPPT